jgi:hypothetical protein
VIIFLLKVLLFIALEHRQDVILDNLGRQFWGYIIDSDLLHLLGWLPSAVLLS